MLYTKGVTDVNYSRPLFAIILTLASVFNCFRIPYRTTTIAIGHYKQTRNGAIIEAVINIVVSVLCTIKFGVIGVAIGSLCAMATRSYEFADYLSKNIIHRSMNYYFSHVFITLSILLSVYLVSRTYIAYASTWVGWFACAVITTLLTITLTVLTDFVFYKKETLYLINRVKNIAFRKKNG